MSGGIVDPLLEVYNCEDQRRFHRRRRREFSRVLHRRAEQARPYEKQIKCRGGNQRSRLKFKFAWKNKKVPVSCERLSAKVVIAGW